MFTGRCCLLGAGLVMERIYTALFSPVATQSTTQYRLTFTRSRTHQSHTDGGVSHSRRQPARRLGAVQGEGVLLEGHLDTRTTRRSRGIEPATLRPPADPLHLLSPMWEPVGAVAHPALTVRLPFQRRCQPARGAVLVR